MDEFTIRYQMSDVEDFPHNITKTPLVSICIQTYQHMDFIAQCIDSILMQKVDFEYEILLGEDASQDGTREICIEYAKNHSDKIRLFLHSRENNIEIDGKPTGRFNLLYNLQKANGKYIALCEGDDYWIDQNKLYEQVTFLENNSEYGLSHTDCNFLYQNDGQINAAINRKETKNNTITENQEIFENILINKYRIRTASVLLRSELLQKIRSYDDNDFIASKFPMGDTPIWLELSHISKFHYIDKPMVVYRISKNSACRSVDPFKDQIFRLRAIELRMYFLYKYDVSINIKQKIKYRFLRKIARLELNDYKFELITPKEVYKSSAFICIMFFVRMKLTKWLYKNLFKNKRLK